MSVLKGGRETVVSLPFHAEVAFCARGRPRSALLSLIVMDPPQEPACSLTLKNEGALGRCCAQEQRCKMAGDGRVVRLICSSGSDTEESGDRRGDQQSHRQREGRCWIQGKYKKPTVYTSQRVFSFLLIIIFKLTSCPVGPV